MSPKQNSTLQFFKFLKKTRLHTNRACDKSFGLEHIPNVPSEANTNKIISVFYYNYHIKLKRLSCLQIYIATKRHNNSWIFGQGSSFVNGNQYSFQFCYSNQYLIVLFIIPPLKTKNRHVQNKTKQNQSIVTILLHHGHFLKTL